MPTSSKKEHRSVSESPKPEEKSEQRSDEAGETAEFFVSDIEHIADEQDGVKQELLDDTVEVIDFSTEDDDSEIIQQNQTGTGVMTINPNLLPASSSSGF